VSSVCAVCCLVDGLVFVLWVLFFLAVEESSVVLVLGASTTGEGV